MLASRAGNARAAFTHLPSQLRLHAYQRCSSRAFSASASRKLEPTEAIEVIDLANIVALPPLGILNGLHTLGIPWWAAIPTTAILVRGVLGHYFASKPVRRRQQINGYLNPLVAANLDQSIHKYREKNMESPSRLRIMSEQIQKTHRYGIEFGAGLIGFTSIINFGAMIATAEAVRMKCGARDGLLSTLMAPFNWIGRHVAPEHFAPAVDAAEARAQDLAARLEHVRELRLQQAQEQTFGAESANDAAFAQPLTSDNLFAASQSTLPPPSVLNVSHFDPTLQTEGLFWCTDLTAVDPTSILPLLIGGAMLATIIFNPSLIPRWVPRAQNMPAPIKFIMTRYSKSQAVYAAITVLIAYALQTVPAAVSLYIFSTFMTGFVTKRWLDLTMPLRKPIQPCARRTRQRSKKIYGARG